MFFKTPFLSQGNVNFFLFFPCRKVSLAEALNSHMWGGGSGEKSAGPPGSTPLGGLGGFGSPGGPQKLL